MAYNSNGYIMLDFSMLDFSRTNQVIEGIYQKVFEIVGTNKFVLILNAQSKTPLPACVSFVNSSYVIESFLYNFAITTDDNVRIENVSSDIIKDGIVSAGTTWSSSKIVSELSKINIDAFCKVIAFTANFTIGGYGSKSITANEFNYEIPEGFKPVALKSFKFGNTSQDYFVLNIDLDAVNSDAMAIVKHPFTGNITTNLILNVLFIKDDFIIE